MLLLVLLPYLYFVVRWCRSTKISSLANSFPGHEWTPFPNGINVLGFGATCPIIDPKNIVHIIRLGAGKPLLKRYPQYHSIILFSLFTSNLEGSNFSGSGYMSGLWWMFLKSGKTFHPFGIRYPARIRVWVIYFFGHIWKSMRKR